ncbi:hypothetical protein [uncultured Pseudoteredinibacter sp.]|uniref:hypothetical protein n=1 Tax=uncultured Pseudoteredinibacter sp. TaxID=1641701 RepID=UPI0026357EF3|nr:hypothetical protein [uncultured Pseudoteredinibacter sp.]
MSAAAKLVIRPQAEGFHYWSKKLSELNWKILPGSRQLALNVCQKPNATAASIATLCRQDPLLCWQLSRRANQLISDRSKWPEQLEQLISLIGIPQVIATISSCEELKQEDLQQHFAVLSRSLINSHLASELFRRIAIANNSDIAKQFELSSLLFRLPEWGISIDTPHMQVQLEFLQHNGTSLRQAQHNLLDCHYSDIMTEFSQYCAILNKLNRSWQYLDKDNRLQIRQALQSYQQRNKGRPSAIASEPEMLLITCHGLIEQLWNPLSFAKHLRLLSGISGLSRPQIHGLLNQCMLSIPWHPSLPIECHPMRWQHCQWKLSRWLPKFVEAQTNETQEELSKNQLVTTKINSDILKSSLKRLLNKQSFKSSNHLLEFTLQSLKRGLTSKAGLIWVYSRGEFKSRHHYGLGEDISPSAFTANQSSNNICLRLLQKAAAVRLSSQHPSLPQGLQILLSPKQEVALMSIFVANKPAALLMLVQDEHLDDEHFRYFKQLGHGFHQALLQQLKVKN